jgi:hypothetical protein
MTFDLDIFSRSKVADHFPVGFVSTTNNLHILKNLYVKILVSRAVILSRIVEHAIKSTVSSANKSLFMHVV